MYLDHSYVCIHLFLCTGVWGGAEDAQRGQRATSRPAPWALSTFVLDKSHPWLETCKVGSPGQPAPGYQQHR